MLRSLSLPTASACSTILLLLSFTPSSICYPGSSLLRRAVIPAPLSAPPAQNWDGVDGLWNLFTLRIGTPPQTALVQISTASEQIWVVDPRGCPGPSPINQTCMGDRGGTFSYEASSSWKDIGLYQLGLETNLDLWGNAEYGTDNVTLGYDGERGISLPNQTVGAFAVTDFYFGHFGINPKPSNWSNYTTTSQSFMHDLKETGQIPSVSWGYTAGAPYRFTKVQGSLTLGGYDSNKFIPNNVTFNFAPDNERDIVVRVQNITSIDSQNKQTTLLSKPYYAYIDSTIAELWLPLQACAAFEQAFNLTWDPATELYLVSDAQHNQLLITNPNITINISPWTGPANDVDQVNIVLPYDAFDLTAKPPYQTLNTSSRYFPLRRAQNSTQYTLGRTFLQEAYLTVDWERNNFSVAQVSWVGGAQQQLVPILPVNGSGNGKSGGSKGDSSSSMQLSIGAIVGIAVGVLIMLALTAVMALFFFRSKKQKAVKAMEEIPSSKTVDTEVSKDDEASGSTLVFPKAELPAETVVRAEADGTFYGKNALGRSVTSSTAPLVESDSKEREVFEMEGDMPSRQEADGRQLTEKDAMKAREERINGVDPSAHSPTVSNEQSSPTSMSPPGTLDNNRRRALLTPGEVIELSPIENRTHQPISPLDGSDGSRTNLFSPLSPLTPGGGTLFPGVSPGGLSPGGVSPDTARKRFSYEDP